MPGLVSSTHADDHQETVLRKLLLEDYDKDSLPQRGFNVSVGITILGLEMDEEKHIMYVDSWVRLTWFDVRFEWNNSSYPGIDYLALSPDLVWTPDLSLYNSGDTTASKHVGDTKVLVWPNGKVLWVPTAKLPAYCVMDLTYWPHDVHNCFIKLGSWVHNQKIIDLQQYDKLPIDDMIPKKVVDSAEEDDDDPDGDKEREEGALYRGMWVLKDKRTSIASKIYTCCPETYVSIKFSLVVERNAPAYCWMVKLPAALLSLLTGILFLLPPGGSEKTVVGTLLVMLQLQFLAYTKHIVDISPSHTPLIVQCISEQLFITVMCVMVSALVLRLVRDPHSDTFPRALQRPVAALEGWLCVSGYRVRADQSNSKWQNSSNTNILNGTTDENAAIVVESSHSGDNFPQVIASEWLLLGAVLDRLFFFLYLLIFVIKLLRYSGVF
ncbi:Neurotransmitter-gated ion-channel ligand-binding domain [Trinorchestia longiramus]|nr:Neurotransmitter-gated ion-channel ligand-binding domain [Trinorchestia longiramus]